MKSHWSNKIVVLSWPFNKGGEKTIFILARCELVHISQWIDIFGHVCMHKVFLRIRSRTMPGGIHTTSLWPPKFPSAKQEVVVFFLGLPFFFWQYYSISSIICEWLFCRTTMVTWKDWKYGGLLGKTTFSPSSNVCSLKIINTNFLPIIKSFRLSFWFDYFEIVILKWQFLDNNETIFEYLEMIFELYYYDIVILRW